MKSRPASKTLRADKTELSPVPHGKVVLYMVLAAIGVMFMGLSCSFLYSSLVHPLPAFRLPVAFHYNTFVILLSSAALYTAVKAMRNDDNRTYRWNLGAAFALGVTFLVLQYIGWSRLLSAGVTFINNQAGSYLYLISGLHAFHVLAGVMALGYVFVRSVLRAYNPVSGLMFDTDPVKKARISLLATYWHFVDILWLYLYLFFVVLTW